MQRYELHCPVHGRIHVSIEPFQPGQRCDRLVTEPSGGPCGRLFDQRVVRPRPEAWTAPKDGSYEISDPLPTIVHPRPLSDDDAAAYYAEMWEPCPDELVLADLASKRKIMALCERILGDEGVEPPSALILADDVLAALALPFADRPGYDEAWRP